MIDIKNLSVDLENKILKSEKVVIVPHNNADFDAIGSAIGLSLIPTKLKKESCIIVNDQIYSVDPGVRIILEESKKDYNIINRDKYQNIVNKDDLYILTDVNKTYLVSVSDFLTNPENIIIIDHHDSDEKTVNSNSIYIDTKSSSASEIVTKLLRICKIKIPPQVANYLYSGIFLDTAKLTKNCSAETMKMVSKLIESGANINKVNELFREDFLSDRRVQSLVSNAEMINCTFAIIVDHNDEEFTREEIAKAADWALKYGADATFAIGRIENGIISISARATGKINVGSIMKEFGGGGNSFSGAAKVENDNVYDVEKRLRKVLRPSYYDEKKD